MEFVANRLSSGNRVFPDKVKIEEIGVTLRSPSLFSGKEHTLMYHQLSSISVENPMFGFTSVVFRTLTNQRIECKGFAKSDAEEIKKMVHAGIQSSRGPGSLQSTFVVDKSNSDAIKAKAELDKALAEVEHRKLDIEERRNRQERSDQLRSQGKHTQAFFTEHSRTIGLILTVVIIGVITFFFINKTNSNDTLDAELTRKDEKIQKLIQQGNISGVDGMIDELQHDSQNQSQHEKGFMMYYTYTDYWKRRREELRKQLQSSSPKRQDVVSAPVPSATNTETAPTQVPDRQNTSIETENIFTIKSEKAYFYNEPSIETKRKGYLISGQTVTSLKQDGDFIYIEYESNNSVTKGWLLKSDLR